MLRTPFRTRRLTIALTILLAASATFSQNTEQFSIDKSPLPAPTGFVNDYAGVIDAAAKQQLETKLREFKETSNPNTELAVALVKTTGDRPIFDYSLAVARGWKIGSKDVDNPSALLFIAIDDRKYFTQVSRDLEDELPDGLVGNLQRQYLVPEFRNGNYGKGISDTIDAYIRTINERRGGIAAPTATPQRTSPRSNTSGGGFSWICCIIIVGIILLIVFSRRGPTGKDRDRWGGPGGGAAGALPWVIGSILSSGSGRGSSSDWGGSSGGWGGGGFGGFGGGGDFGGGGAGGSW
jgi:uncharacterized protein